MKSSVLIVAAAALMVSAAPAMAVRGFPTGTPTNSDTDLLSITGTYASLPTPADQPFAALPFTVDVNIPTNVTISFTNTATPEAFFISSGISGSYTNNGQTEDFSNGGLQVNQFIQNDVPITQLQIDIYNILTASDELFIYPNLTGSLYTFSSDSTSATANPGAYLVPSGEATYNVDPAFTGAATVTLAGGVPEPATWALFLMGFGAIGWTLRDKRKGNAAIA